MADCLSRIPGSEMLTAIELCSASHTLGVTHSVDLPVALCGVEAAPGVAEASQPAFLGGIISINEQDSLRDKLLAEQ